MSPFRWFIRRYTLFLFTGLLVALAACGYRLGGVPCESHLTVRKIGVPLFQNRSFEPRAEDVLTESFRVRVQALPCFSLSPVGRADALLKGTILSIQTYPVAVDTDFLALEYGMLLALTVTLEQCSDKKILWRANRVEQEIRFYASSDPMLLQVNNREALEKAARVISERVMDQLLLGF